MQSMMPRWITCVIWRRERWILVVAAAVVEAAVEGHDALPLHRRRQQVKAERFPAAHRAMQVEALGRRRRRRVGLGCGEGVVPHQVDTPVPPVVELVALVLAAGGQVVGPVCKVGGEAPWQREIVVTHDFITERLGFDIPAAAMRASFEALELTVTREEITHHPSRGPAWTVSIPSWRDDLDRPIDLVEEVMRLYGTEKIPASVVQSPGLVGDDDPIVGFTRRRS